MDEKEGRAVAYAQKRGVDVCQVVLQWWKADKARVPWCYADNSCRRPSQSDEQPCSDNASYDNRTVVGRNEELEDWFEKRLKALDDPL